MSESGQQTAESRESSGRKPKLLDQVRHRWPMAQTSAPCKSCWATKTSARRKSIRTC